MALSYDQRKKSYESLDDSKKQQYNDLLKSKGDDYIGNQYMKQYNGASQTQQTNNNTQSGVNSSNFNNQNGTNGQNTTQTPTINKTEAQNNNQNYNKDVSPDLDQSKFNEAPGKITVQEGTAQVTGRPDYQANSEARLNEMKANLDQYFKDSPWMFQDRETFNRVFEYDKRDSEAQRQLLDSYWKRKQDIDKASQYNTGDSIANGMKDAEITTDQLNYIKEYSPEAYREWMQKQLDDINLRIANLATPADPTDNAELFANLAKQLNLEPGDPYQIYDNWYNMCERLGVFKDSEKLASYQNQLDQNHSKMESIISRYTANTGGAVSDALAGARLQKALAPYQQREVDLQNSYTTLLNGRNSNLAVANQSATALSMQAQEDQRIFNQRLQGLGFAMTTAQYRSPEQQAQLQLQTQQIQNNMSLLQQGLQNDLSLYNQYATTKLQNQLSYELSDLSVEDPAQLKANLNNVLSSYYQAYGAIIQRPQAQVVEDVIAYAKEKGISVAQALKENFITPLQNKKEYKTKVAQDYGMDKYQQQYSYSIDEDGNIKITATGYGEIPESAFKTRASRQEAYGDVYDNSVSWEAYIQNLAGSIKDGSYGGQCGAFCNDVLIGGGESKVFGDSLKQKIDACNVKKEDGPQVGYAVVFDLGFTSSDGENHGHVGFISNVNGDGSIDVIESNGKSDKTIHVKRYSKAAVDKMVVGYYKPSNYDIQKEVGSTNTYQDASDSQPYSGVSKTTKTGVEVNAGGWITDLESEYIKEKWDNKDVMNQTLASYGITIQEYNAQKKKYLDYQAKVSLIEDTKKMYDAVQDLLTWNQENSSTGAGSRHSGWTDINTYNRINGEGNKSGVVNTLLGYDAETANGINKYNYLKNSQLLEKYQQLKKAGATFGAMQKSEWDLVGSAASNLNWLSTDEEFEKNLKNMLNHYANILADAGVEGFYNTDI